MGLEAIAITLEVIASRLEAIASRLEAIASRFEAFKRLEDHANTPNRQKKSIPFKHELNIASILRTMAHEP